MIFVTVGTQLPFDRMVRAVDDWAVSKGCSDIFAQVGTSSYQPRRIRCVPSLHPAEFKRRFMEATIVISHAGMGSIISAVEVGKPLIVVPRRAALGEHRNDHQLATARRFVELGVIRAAFDEHEVGPMIEEWVASRSRSGESAGAAPASHCSCPEYDAAVCASRRIDQACPRLLSVLGRFVDQPSGSAPVLPCRGGSVV